MTETIQTGCLFFPWGMHPRFLHLRLHNVIIDCMLDLQEVNLHNAVWCQINKASLLLVHFWMKRMNWICQFKLSSLQLWIVLVMLPSLSLAAIANGWEILGCFDKKQVQFTCSWWGCRFGVWSRYSLHCNEALSRWPICRASIEQVFSRESLPQQHSKCQHPSVWVRGVVMAETAFIANKLFSLQLLFVLLFPLLL